MTSTTRLIAALALGAALLAPVAQAQRPDDRAGIRGPGAFEQAVVPSHPDNRGDARGPGGIATRPVTSRQPDDRDGIRGPGAFTTGTAFTAIAHPDNRDGLRGPGAVTTTVVAQPLGDGFDWNDALIGGLGGVAAALLLMGSLFLVASQRSKARLA